MMENFGATLFVVGIMVIVGIVCYKSGYTQGRIEEHEHWRLTGGRDPEEIIDNANLTG